MGQNLDLLHEPFPEEVLRERSKGGTSLTYVPIAEVIARLNLSLGVDGWSVSDAQVWADDEHPNWILSKVTLAAHVGGAGGRTVTKVGYGGQEVKYYSKGKNQGKPIDLGDDYKGAMSDALKKAAQQLGVGLELARDEEALEVEARRRREIEDEGKPRATEEQLKAIIAYTDTLEKGTGKYENFVEWWKVNVGKKIDSGNVTEFEADNCLEYFDIHIEPVK